MATATPAVDSGRRASFCAEIVLPYEVGVSVSGTVEVSPTALTVLTGGTKVELAVMTVTMKFGGNNNECVVLEGEVGLGSPHAGARFYLQSTDLSILGCIAANGPRGLRAAAVRLSRKQQAASLRRRVLWAAAAVIVVTSALLPFLFFDHVVKRAVSGVPIAWENRLGEFLFATMTAGRPRASEKDQALVKAVFERLRTHAAPEYDFAFAVLDSPDVNAFALPGGKFVVFSGLLAKAGRPEEVAGVLGHEFGHAALRHGLQQMVRAVGLRAVVALLLGDLAGLGGVVRDAGVQVQELSYGRDHEREADLGAIGLLARAGIDPAGLPEFFDRLAAKEGNAGGAAGNKALTLLSTHPASAERGDTLRAAIAKLGPRRYEPILVPRFPSVMNGYEVNGPRLILL